MDIVDTFNHLIPSDQLDDPILIGQNLECEANEFGSGLELEDSLKNMLSDKDPMFGSASSQFNLLDNEDSNFQIAGATGLDVGSTSSGLSGTAGAVTCAETAVVKRPVGRPRKKPTNLENEQSDGQETANLSTNTKSRGRPGRKPANKQLKSFLIEKGVKTAQLKKELYQGGRINIHNVDVGLWLNPVVVLRRLTVTVGGFRIELLPGPWENTGTGQPVCLEDGFTCGGDVEFAMVQDDSVNVQDDSVNVQDDSVNVQNPIPENVRDLGVPEKSCAEDAPPPLGPYVNPNDVQAANGTVTESPCLAETKLDNQSVSAEPKPASEGEGGATQPQDIHNNKTTPTNKMDSKEKQEVLAKKRLKSKQGPTSIKTKSLVPGSPSSMIKGPTVSQDTPSKTIQRGDVHNMKPLKREEKKAIASLKRHGENVSSEPAAKVQRTQDTSPITAKPKSPGTSSSVVKRTLSSDSRPGEQQGLTKHAHSHVSPKPESAHLTQDTPAHSSKTLDEGGPEKPKAKKPEKTLQKQKSKTPRSISVDEPQLFIPDNAPIVKKETAEEQPANSDTMWDGNNNCGLCKKHHNNTFMVGCGRCDDWFHGDCVGLDLTKVREMMEEDQMYVCLKCCAEESTKVEPDAPSAAKPEAPAKHEVQDNKLPPKPRQGPSQSLTSGGVRPVGKESDRRQSTEVKDATQKTGVQVKQESKSKGSTLKKPVSVEEIRRSVRDSLKEILLQRLKESDLKIALEKASEVAKKTERELFHLYKDTDSKYKNKYRSLMFNLKDIKNNVLFKRVLRGEISPGNLIRMSPEELASKELAAWRQRENRHTIEMIEKEQRKTERRPITKITHKGEIEIESEEPAKVPETTEVELEPALKVTEEPAELLALESKSESTKTDKDTTNQHKSHLFDLHCKICTGRMAPPVEEAPVKVVKVATTVVRRQPTKMEETKRTPPPVKDDDLHLTVLEESFLNAKPSSNEPRSEYLSGRDKAFLSNLKSLWRGFLNMPAVAKLVTKSFPVSGVLDNLTEDLPDSIQVGGRITPQMVWDYLEKIRATGTKEVCLIRFSPETEEDEISYTLLYAYFSSRKRFGVVSNNLKQVKDMYLIPLGATEKVPHQLVPFDGPGLENNRGNLLLGLIIRQRPKRDFLPVDVTDAARIIPESKPLAVSTNDGRGLEDEKFYLSALTAVHTKEADKLLNSAEDVDEPITESFEEASVSEEGNNQESNKPLRFLPGVLLGWGGELPPLPDVGGKPVPAADDPQKTQVVPKADEGTATKSPTAATTPRDRFVIKKKEPKAVKAEPELPGPTDTSIANSLSGKDVAVVTHGASVSLKDKPTDVSTEAFLASLSTTPTGNEANSAVSANKGDVGLLSETENGKPEGNSSLKSPAASDHTHTSKPPLSGILKKCSAYSSVSEEKQTEVAPKDNGSQPAPLNPQPVPVLSSTRNDPILVSHHGYSHLSQAEHRPGEEVQSNISSSHSEREDPGMSQAAPMVTPTVYLPSVQGPQAASYAPAHTEATGFQYDSVMAPTYNNAAPFPPQQQQPQVPGSYDYPIGPPSNTFPTPQDPRDQNHATQWAQESAMASQAPPGLQYPDSYAESSSQPPSLGKDYKRLEDQYSDPWERPRHTEDRDHYGRHSHRGDSHHGKKSRHHDRERGKKRERSHEDKYKERSRHHGHSEERHGERRKERHHSDDHSSRHKDRHRSRRDSDYENGRRSSKDSYS